MTHSTGIDAFRKKLQSEPEIMALLDGMAEDVELQDSAARTRMKSG